MVGVGFFRTTAGGVAQVPKNAATLAKMAGVPAIKAEVLAHNALRALVAALGNTTALPYFAVGALGIFFAGDKRVSNGGGVVKKEAVKPLITPFGSKTPGTSAACACTLDHGRTGLLQSHHGRRDSAACATAEEMRPPPLALPFTSYIPPLLPLLLF